MNPINDELLKALDALVERQAAAMRAVAAEYEATMTRALASLVPSFGGHVFAQVLAPLAVQARTTEVVVLDGLRRHIEALN